MTISMYQASVPVFSERLGALSKCSRRPRRMRLERKIDPQVLLTARLAPDMLALTSQIQIATDHAKGARPGWPAAKHRNTRTPKESFAELQARIAKTLDFLAELSRRPISTARKSETIEIKARPAGAPSPA